LFAGSVLVVEDDSDLRESLCNILEDEGFSTLKAGNGQEALDFLHNAQPSELPDVILLDLMMPVMNGSTFYARMCLETSLSAVRVIVMTAHGSSRDALNRLPLLRKPLHIEELLSAIRAAS